MGRPTSIRFLIIGVSVLMSIKLYLDRFALSSMQPYITEELRLSEFAVASLLGTGFFLSYALGQVPAGWLCDRFGPRAMLASYILVWSLFTALTGVVQGFTMLMVARLACGLGQAGAYPACGTLLSRWVPLSSRGTASSLVALGGRVGAVIVPILTGWLMVAFVPLSTPVEFTADQLLNEGKLAARLTSEDRSGAVNHLVSLMPEAVAVHVAELGQEYRGWEAFQKLPETDRRRNSPKPERLAPASREVILKGLNGLLDDPRLHSDNFLTKPDHPFAGLSLEREARVSMTHLQEGKSLSTAEARRLNRMIIEAVLPEIKKLYGRGWRPVLLLYGLAGILVAGVFWFAFRDFPRQHPLCNEAEAELIEAGKPKVPPAPPSGIPWGSLVRSRSLWASSIMQFGTNVGWLLVVTYMPRYLLEVYKVPLADRSLMVAIPGLGGIVGMYLGGWLTDFLTRKLGLRWGRALPMALTRFGAGAAYLICIQSKDPWVATAAFTLMFFFVDLGVSSVWAFVQDVGGRNVGSVLGWGNMWGNIGAAVALQIYGLFLGPNPGAEEWNQAFLVCAGAFAVSGVAGAMIDATQPVVPEDTAST